MYRILCTIPPYCSNTTYAVYNMYSTYICMCMYGWYVQVFFSYSVNGSIEAASDNAGRGAQQVKRHMLFGSATSKQCTYAHTTFLNNMPPNSRWLRGPFWEVSKGGQGTCPAALMALSPPTALMALSPLTVFVSSWLATFVLHTPGIKL